MTLTQALYDQICEERHFELLILSSLALGQDVMTFDYNAINDCIHTIAGNQETFNRVSNSDEYPKLHTSLNAFITGQNCLGAGDVDDVMELLSFVKVNAMHGNKTVILKEIMQAKPMKNVKAAFDELAKALSENTDSLGAVEPYAENVDAQLMIAGYRPVLTM